MVKNQEATETAVVLGYEVPPSSAKNGLAESRAFIIARRPEFFVVAWDRAVCFNGAPLRPIVSAVLARGLCVEIPLFFLRSRDRGSKDAIVFPEI